MLWHLLVILKYQTLFGIAPHQLPFLRLLNLAQKLQNTLPLTPG